MEVSLLNKTTSSICIAWSMIRGVVSGFLLSITNATSSEELIIPQEGHRSVCPTFIPFYKNCSEECLKCVHVCARARVCARRVCVCACVPLCVHRYYCFGGLAPGSRYTIKVISISEEKRSKPSDIILHTSTLNMYSESRVRIDNRYS